MKTLRELMTDEIASYGWFDYYFKRGDHNAKTFTGVGGYRKWLETLSDEDFLAIWKNISERINNLD